MRYLFLSEGKTQRSGQVVGRMYEIKQIVWFRVTAKCYFVHEELRERDYYTGYQFICSKAKLIFEYLTKYHFNLLNN